MRFIIGIIFLGLAHFCAAQNSASKPTPASILTYFQQNHIVLGISEKDSKEAKISDLYSDADGRFYHAYLQQYINGIPVLNAIYGLHFSQSGELKYTANSFSAFSANVPEFKNTEITVQAMLSASIASGVDIRSGIKRIDLGVKTQFNEQEQYYYPCYFSNEQGGLPIPAFNVIAYNHNTSDWWNIVISEIDGSVIEKINWTVSCKAEKSGNNHPLERRSSADGEYKAFSYPIESPMYGSVVLLSKAEDSIASPYGWLDANGIAGPDYKYTRGNNVYASEDKNADNVAGYSPQGDSLYRFDFSYNPAETDPSKYLDFAITNLFVANNLLHDISFRYGFDESAGNFQFRNYSGKGAGNDAVNADAQDGSGTNNANFSTPPDGSTPRMQMFVWDATSGSGPTLKVNSPTKDKYSVGTAQFGKKLTTVPMTEGLVLVNDGTGDPAKGCNALKNATLIKGKIAAIQRGTCTFTKKVYNAQLAGAIAVVILDSSSANQAITMSGTDSRITIPAVIVNTTNGKTLYQQMQSGLVNITLYDSSGASPKTDSDLDMLVMAHEYTHGISTRLTCGPAVSTGLSNAEQMGEGWSDYYGLAFTQRRGDLGVTPRGVGNWLLGQDSSGSGIRNYQYSTNMSVNPLTYKAIAEASATGRAPVHFVGEVWCTMLWDMHWKLIEKYGYDPNLYSGKGGNNIAIKLVMDGMKLQKCNPGFIDGRNAILKADSLYNNGQNARSIWEVFARRGLGFSAKQGLSTSTSDGTEAFDMPVIYSGNANLVSTGKADLRMWPNPSGGQIFLEPANVKSVSDVVITDLSGKNLKASVTVLQNGAVMVNTHNLSNGVYLISCKTEKGNWSARFVKLN